MCEACVGPALIDRRQVLRGAAATAAVGLVAVPLAACGRIEDPALSPVEPLTGVGREVVPGLWVRPRSDWGSDLSPRGPIPPETVSFLLLHHSQTPNDGRDERNLIRSVYAFHTGPAKRWPDVCYHYFVGPSGTIWEGRSGSLDGPVLADATGGNQGWAQLVCLLGDHRDSPPTAAAQQSLVALLAWLRWRYRLPAPDAQVSYVSRGSNRHPAGTTVTTTVISGHRDATYTECPGDAAYALLPTWRAAVAAVPDPEFPVTGPLRPARRLGRGYPRW